MLAGVDGSSTTKATALSNGVALPPLEAPEAVRQIIEAGNSIARTPYKWGGGHGKWQDTGYDCSGSVSFALAAAGLLDAPLASGPLMSWGEAGKGKWVTIYSNPGHVYLEVAGIRFDTSAPRETGSRWTNTMRSHDGLRRAASAGSVSALGVATPSGPPASRRYQECSEFLPEENRLPDDPLPPRSRPDRRLRSRTRSTPRGSGLRRSSTASMRCSSSAIPPRTAPGASSCGPTELRRCA